MKRMNFIFIGETYMNLNIVKEQHAYTKIKKCTMHNILEGFYK